MSPILISILLIVGLAVFCRTMYYKILLLMSLEPENRKGRIKDRIKNVIALAFCQKRLVGRKKERISGIMHAFIFWGFCILLIRSLNLYGEGFVKGYHLPFLGDHFILGYIYLSIKDIMEGIVLFMVIFAIFRRAVLKPARLHNTWEAYLVLVLIGILMFSDLLYDAARYNLIVLYNNPEHLHFFNNPQYGSEFAWTPISTKVGATISWMNIDAIGFVLIAAFWLHVITQLVFLNLLPTGKHFHVITSLPNIFLKNLDYPHKKTSLLDLEDETAWEDESLGLNHIHQLDWKQGLDLYTCTECGRCKEVCPAYITDKPLNLFDFNNHLKTELFENAKYIIKRFKLSTSIKKETDINAIKKTKTEMLELNSKKQLIGDIITADTLWACTTCRTCEEVCPVAIEHVPRILSMRQGQTLMKETYPKELNTAFKGLERNGNPWGIGYDKRADWAKGLNVKTMGDDSGVDYLLWAGCAASFDDRTQKVIKSFVKILQMADINFAILGVEEKCTGDFARKVGNEMLYQMMAGQNIETLNKYKVKKIITVCPHCLNTLKHEYPQMGGKYQVIHSTQFINQLVKEGKIILTKSLEGPLTYHDPCYLGRYNGVYEQPRSILSCVAKDEFKELNRNAQESFCCGAGGGRMWMKENIGKRINIERAEEIIGRKVTNVAVGCPFCLTMLEDGMKELAKEEEIKTLDIAEIVLKNMETQPGY